MLFNSLAFHKTDVLNQIYIKYHQINSFVPFYSRYLKTYKSFYLLWHFILFSITQVSLFFSSCFRDMHSQLPKHWLNSNKPLLLYWRVFSCGSAHKESGRPRFNTWVGKIPWRRERPPTLVCSVLENSMGCTEWNWCWGVGRESL